MVVRQRVRAIADNIGNPLMFPNRFGMSTSSIRFLPFMVIFLILTTIAGLIGGFRGGSRKSLLSFMSPTADARIAFHVQVSNATLPLLPRLLSRLYNSENFYLIHIDPSADAARRKEAIEKSARLFRKGNVYFMDEETMTYQGVTLVINTVNAMQRLLDLGDWDYFTNLSAGDYPFVEAKELRRHLGKAKSSEALFMSFSPRQHWEWKVQSRLGQIHADSGLSLVVPPGERTRLIKSYKPNSAAVFSNGSIAAGDAWMIVPRSFCDYAAFSIPARRLLALMSTMSDPIEHFFHTLVWNEPLWKERVRPHGLRHIVWHFKGQRAGQHPYYLDHMIPEENGTSSKFLLWPNIRKSPYFFGRKFVIPNSPLMDLVDNTISGTGSKIDRRMVRAAQRRRRKTFECFLNKHLGEDKTCGVDPNFIGDNNSD
eukprot:Plantae.Rhodophyta-Hildenbrandia_rubra.ctg11590.p1 GENE.Plantae.Rhodophyta-Hildenbrandia_rubra.ctg11590~~Plantae.Rhodophyta-Hildenbrandia_rubra.ctg11590.p1  ORF type:complete len:426 (-),score=58.47 Plantae.Rhodophyta-Hildenbrandia_rubra.ctg11590:791-2068(-)